MEKTREELLRKLEKHFPYLSLGEKSSIVAADTLNGFRNSDKELFAYMDDIHVGGSDEMKFMQSTAKLQLAEQAFMR